MSQKQVSDAFLVIGLVMLDVKYSVKVQELVMMKTNVGKILTARST